MSLYDNMPDSNEKQLQSYYPVWYRDVREMSALWRAMGEVLDELQENTDRTIDNNFIYLADEASITAYEKFLSIPYNPQRPLSERRKLVASFFVGNGHIGEDEIKEIVLTFTPSPCQVSFANGQVSLTVTRDINDIFLLTDCYFILLKKLPAHLGLAINVVSPFSTPVYVGVSVNRYKEEVIHV